MKYCLVEKTMSLKFTSSVVYRLLSTFILFLFFEVRVKAIPHEVTFEICQLFTLRKGVNASNDPCPFEFILNQDQILSNEILKLTFKSKSTTSGLKGFFIMGFDPKTDFIVGKFRKVPHQISQTPGCYGIYEPVFTQTVATENNSVTSVEWIPPEDYYGDVVFKTAFVQDNLTFWVNHTSKIVSVIRSDMSVTVDPTLTTEEIVLPNAYEGCGISKSCTAIPIDCITSQSCLMLTTYKQVGNYLEMEIYGQISKNKYVAAGFSTDGQMGADSVVECVYYDGLPKVYQSYNFPEKKNERLSSQMEGFHLLYAVVSDDYIYCQVEHPINYTVNTDSFNLDEQFYYILMASGPTNEERIGRHTLKGSTISAINLSSTDQISYLTEDSRTLKRLHGSFMVIAWLVGGSIGMLMPRVPVRQILNRKFMGQDLWFVIHRGIMLIVWTLTMIAFILIFVDVGGWVSQNAHPIFGCIVTGLAFFQPIMAFLRPEPDASNRYIFNRAHFLVGHLAHLLAHITIYLAIGMEAAQLPEEMYWILSAHLGVYVAMQALMIYLTRKPSIRNLLDKVKDDTFCRVNCWGPTGTKVTLAVYIFVILALGTTMVVLIAGA